LYQRKLEVLDEGWSHNQNSKGTSSSMINWNSWS